MSSYCTLDALVLLNKCTSLIRPRIANSLLAGRRQIILLQSDSNARFGRGRDVFKRSNERQQRVALPFAQRSRRLHIDWQLAATLSRS